MDRVIKSDAEYKAALAEIERLIDSDPGLGTPEGERLELLTVLVQDYESRKYGTPAPDPIEAIQFRMEQQKLTQRDLVPYIGSRSKVSEVLARKRPLTLSMMKALHSGLGIPAKALLQDRHPDDLEEVAIDWHRFPLKEMIARGWIVQPRGPLFQTDEDLVRGFFSGLASSRLIVALYRQTRHIRSGRTMDLYSLTAWTARVVMCARQEPVMSKYIPGTVNLQFMRNLARLSVFEAGPRLAQEYLNKHGILFAVELHLSGTYLDGAAIMNEPERPVVGMTLRYDRVDNFWFCLMHELAHIALHFDQGIAEFYDDLDVSKGIDPREVEADRLASDALIPREAWEKSPASRLRTPEAARDLANRLGIHPAIVAGRMRHKFGSYRVLNRLVGHGEVRKLFPDTRWVN